jgi:hypothetical protein
MSVRAADKGAPRRTGRRYVIDKLAASAKEAYILSSTQRLSDVTAGEIARLDIHAITTRNKDSFPAVCLRVHRRPRIASAEGIGISFTDSARAYPCPGACRLEPLDDMQKRILTAARRADQRDEFVPRLRFSTTETGLSPVMKVLVRSFTFLHFGR